jgi:acyl-CoA synthetase (AMP-forming)/AMP-acid ligase II
LQALRSALPWGTGTAAAIAASCARYPSAPAVIDDDGRLTYRELWRESDHLAALLLDEVGPVRRVGLLARTIAGWLRLWWPP